MLKEANQIKKNEFQIQRKNEIVEVKNFKSSWKKRKNKNLKRRKRKENKHGK